MNHSNNKLRGLDISSNPEIDGVTISIPGNGLRTFISHETPKQYQQYESMVQKQAHHSK